MEVGAVQLDFVSNWIESQKIGQNFTKVHAAWAAGIYWRYVFVC